MGFPMMSARAFPSNRVDAYLAGITAVTRIGKWAIRIHSDRVCPCSYGGTNNVTSKTRKLSRRDEIEKREMGDQRKKPLLQRGFFTKPLTEIRILRYYQVPIGSLLQVAFVTVLDRIDTTRFSLRGISGKKPAAGFFIALVLFHQHDHRLLALNRFPSFLTDPVLNNDEHAAFLMVHCCPVFP